MIFLSHEIQGATIPDAVAVVNELELEYRAQVFQFVLEKADPNIQPKVIIIFKVDDIDDRVYRFERALKLLPTKM